LYSKLEKTHKYTNTRKLRSTNISHESDPWEERESGSHVLFIFQEVRREENEMSLDLLDVTINLGNDGIRIGVTISYEKKINRK
jgi:hypothetical protein